MANIKSNEKSFRQDKKVHKNNHPQLSKMRTIVKKTRNTPTEAQLSEGYKVVDTVARKNIIHKNKANRLKSRLAKKANQEKLAAANA